MKRNIRACRIVLTNGNVIMDYIDNCGMRGIAVAGTYNLNCQSICNCTQEEFVESIKGWMYKNIDNEDVEYIEVIYQQ